jgi:hypothetical protein
MISFKDNEIGKKMFELDSYWSDPKEESPRTKRVFDGIKHYVSNLNNLLFVVIKSWNDNVVLYEYDELVLSSGGIKGGMIIGGLTYISSICNI